MFTFRTCDNRTALIRFFLYSAVLSNAFCERTHSQVAHEHPIVTGTVEARFIGDDAITFIIVLEVVVTAFHLYK
jgi:hypothetical protein